jgi:hypothetical protein
MGKPEVRLLLGIGEGFQNCSLAQHFQPQLGELAKSRHPHPNDCHRSHGFTPPLSVTGLN